MKVFSIKINENILSKDFLNETELISRIIKLEKGNKAEISRIS